MSNELPSPTPNKRTKSSTARTLIQAAALAAALVPLGSVAVETASVTCTFNNTGSGGYGGSYCNGGDMNATEDTISFDFGDYYLELMFTGMSGSFSVTVNTTTNVALTQPEVGPSPFPGYECIALSATHGCVDFQVNTYGAQSGTNWAGYEIAIDWNDWNNELYEGIQPRMRMLHDSSEFDGAEAAGTYDFDMCQTPGYIGCTAEINPRIRSGDTDFDSVIAALAPATPVPEPSSLLLLGTGAGAALYRKRRRSKV